MRGLLRSLLMPVVWAPWFLGIWERKSERLSAAWGTYGVKEVPMQNPWHVDHTADIRPCLSQLKEIVKSVGGYLAIAGLICVIGVVSLFVIQCYIFLMNTPIWYLLRGRCTS